MITIGQVEYGRILAFKDCGLSVAEVAAKLRCDARTIRYWLARKSGPSMNRKRSRNCKVQDLIRRRRGLVKKYVSQKVTRIGVRFTPKLRKARARTVQVFPHHNPRSIAGTLLRQHNIKCSKATVRRDLLALGFVPRHRRRGPLLSDKNLTERVAFGKDFHSYEDLLDLFVWGDEKKFTDNQSQSEVVWVAKGQQPPTRTVVQGPAQVSYFLLIGVGFRMLIQLPDATLTKETFQKFVLDKVVKALKGTNRVPIIDNAPPHSTWKDYLRRRKVKTPPFNWPACSPDGNCVEQMNGIVDAAVQRRAPVGKDELCKFVEEEFARVPQSVVDKLAKSAASRWERIVKAKGHTIKP